MEEWMRELNDGWERICLDEINIGDALLYLETERAICKPF